MSAEAILEQVDALEEEERKRLIQILIERELDEDDPKSFVKYWTGVADSSTKWYTREDLMKIVESTPDDDDSI